MRHQGRVKGNVIELDEPIPLSESTRVEVTVVPETQPRKGSADAVLQLAGTLTPEEAELILTGAQQCRRIDWEM